MIPTSQALSHWLLPVSGAIELPRVLQPLTQAVELNRQGAQMLSKLGKRGLEGRIGLVDMRGFSDLAKGNRLLLRTY